MIADMCIRILAHHGIHPVVKWVDNFVFFREPSTSAQPLPYVFPYDLANVFSVTKPLGISWHSISKKGQDFAPHFDYVGFSWNITTRSVTVPDEKRLRAIAKLHFVLSTKHYLIATLHPSTAPYNTLLSCTGMAAIPSLASPISWPTSQAISSNITSRCVPVQISYGGNRSWPTLTSHVRSYLCQP